MSESFSSQTPFTYAANNPVNLIDYDGQYASRHDVDDDIAHGYDEMFLRMFNPEWVQFRDDLNNSVYWEHMKPMLEWISLHEPQDNGSSFLESESGQRAIMIGKGLLGVASFFPIEAFFAGAAGARILSCEARISRAAEAGGTGARVLSAESRGAAAGGRVLSVEARSANTGRNVAFGLGDDLFNFASTKGFETYRNFSSGFQQNKILSVIENNDISLHFNLTGFSRYRYSRFDPTKPITNNNITNWELNTIYNTPGALDRTTFYNSSNGNYNIVNPPF